MRFKIPENIILAFLEDNFGEIRRTTSEEIRVNSPFVDDRKFHMYVNPEKGVVNDFKSGYGGSFIRFVSEFSNIGTRAAISHLIKNYSGRGSFEDFSITEYLEKSKEFELPEGLNWFAETKEGIIRNQAYRYLKKRKVSEKTISEFGYIYKPGSEYNRMIFIPFYEDGELVYYITRDFTEKEEALRYNFPHGMNSKQFVYNIDKIEDEVFIFEGVFDAIALEKQVGTAILSGDLGKQQAVKILNKAPKRIVFVPDNDDTGEDTLEKNIELLLKYKPPSLSIEVFIYKVKAYKDFSKLREKTGQNYINIEECKKWQKLDLENAVETMFRR
jgi:DNA primase